MNEDAAAAVDPYADRYGASYSIYGTFDVDALLAAVTPRSPFDVWRKGDVRSSRGRTARSSGVRIDICEDRDGLEPAVVRFLLEERAFLAAAAKLASPTVWSVLTCRMWVYAAVPSQVFMSNAAARQIASAGVDLVVVGYPCADHEGP
jgi:hypothetical protein